MISSHKRKYGGDDSEENSDFGDDYSEVAASDDEIDISSALTSKRPRVALQDDDDDDEGLRQIMAQSISQRNIKSGTEIVKKAKGKNKLTKGEVGGGSFQSMGLHASLLRSLTLQGFRIPTPIQRLAIPALLAAPPRDLVGMARTGSGKSLAYMIPLVQRLGGRHATAFGARALILLPTRELALQILKVGKELARGWHSSNGDHAGDKEESHSSKHSQALRWGLIVGGEGLDEQFEMITNNPDVIIATPGRLLHLIVEMNLDLKSVQYVVFDEADRLFEMGFETALGEILTRLPACRQTLLFSATLPKSLLEFAKAGLQNPKLVRLDSESKISTDLKMAFFSVKQAEKDACLLSLLRDVIKVPFGSKPLQDEGDKKGKGKAKYEHFTAPHQTLIFAATKHHVEYLTNFLITAGYSVSHIYGTLDQGARTMQMDQFRRGLTNLLVVTDVAARGIDIPVLENVVNYDFPQGARVFVHRVGRTARAGRQGWAWSFITHTELPYLLDLQLFLGRPLKSDVIGDADQEYTESLILGTFQRDTIDEDMEYVRSLEEANHSLPSLRDVMKRGHSMYERSKGKASPQSYKRAKEMAKDPKWMLTGVNTGIHPVLLRGPDGGKKREEEDRRKALLRTVSSFRPTETILEAGGKANAENAALMKERRKALQKSAQRALASTSAAIEEDDEEESKVPPTGGKEVEMADEAEIMAVFETGNKKKTFKDEDFYMSHYQKDAMTEKGYSLRDGASFVEQASHATFDLAGDDGAAAKKRSMLAWDKKKKKFVKGGGVGADNVKLVKTESGIKLPASYRSGRFDEWKAKNHVSLPKNGETENDSARGNKMGGKRFKHNLVQDAKPLHKLNKDYERKTRQTKKKDGEEQEQSGGRGGSGGRGRGGGRGGAMGGRYAGKSVGRVKSELKSADQVRKGRQLLERKRAKNARPSRGGGKKRR